MTVVIPEIISYIVAKFIHNKFTALPPKRKLSKIESPKKMNRSRRDIDIFFQNQTSQESSQDVTV